MMSICKYWLGRLKKNYIRIESKNIQIISNKIIQ